MKPSHLDRSVRRVDKWLKVPDMPETATDAYRKLVESLVEAMVAVGPVDAMSGITALTKTLALMLSATLRLEDDAKVSEICLGQAAWLENEVMALRKATAPNVKKGN